MQATLIALIGGLFLIPLTHDAHSQIWVDTDAACTGHERRDPDDCLALYVLAKELNEFRGNWSLSVTYGNHSQAAARGVVEQLRDRMQVLGVVFPEPFLGAAAAFEQGPSEAALEICRRLSNETVHLLVLGPFTTAAQVIAHCSEFASQRLQVIAVAGRRPGHVFHPAEENSAQAFMGHGPIFRDLNVELDARAAEVVVAGAASITLTPYELARQFTLSGAAIEAFAGRGGVNRWLAEQCAGWLDYWREYMGTDGFYPFDLMAVLALLDGNALECRSMHVRMETDFKVRWFGGPKDLLFSEMTQGAADHKSSVCTTLSPAAERKLRSWMSL